MISLEEEEQEEEYGSWARQPVEDEPFLSNLTSEERDVIRGFDRRARRYSKRSGRYRRTHLALGIMSIVAAAFVPVMIAIGAPNWVAAVLGAIAAVAQSVAQLTHVDQYGFEIHSMLVRLSARRDRLKADVRRAEMSAQRSALVDAYERDAIALLADVSARLASLDQPEPKPRAVEG